MVDWEDCGDEYILPEYTMSTPSTNSTSQRRSSLPQNTRDPRKDTRNRLDLAEKGPLHGYKRTVHQDNAYLSLGPGWGFRNVFCVRKVPLRHQMSSRMLRTVALPSSCPTTAIDGAAAIQKLARTRKISPEKGNTHDYNENYVFNQYSFDEY